MTRGGTARGDEGPAIGDCGNELWLRVGDVKVLEARDPFGSSSGNEDLGLSLRRNKAAVAVCGGDCAVGDDGGHDGFPDNAKGAVEGSGGGGAGSGVAGVEPPPPKKRRTPFMSSKMEDVQN